MSCGSQNLRIIKNFEGNPAGHTSSFYHWLAPINQTKLSFFVWLLILQAPVIIMDWRFLSPGIFYQQYLSKYNEKVSDYCKANIKYIHFTIVA